MPFPSRTQQADPLVSSLVIPMLGKKDSLAEKLAIYHNVLPKEAREQNADRIQYLKAYPDRKAQLEIARTTYSRRIALGKTLSLKINVGALLFSMMQIEDSYYFAKTQYVDPRSLVASKKAFDYSKLYRDIAAIDVLRTCLEPDPKEVERQPKEEREEYIHEQRLENILKALQAFAKFYIEETYEQAPGTGKLCYKAGPDMFEDALKTFAGTDDVEADAYEAKRQQLLRHLKRFRLQDDSKDPSINSALVEEDAKYKTKPSDMVKVRERLLESIFVLAPELKAKQEQEAKAAAEKEAKRLEAEAKKAKEGQKPGLFSSLPFWSKKAAPESAEKPEPVAKGNASVLDTPVDQEALHEALGKTSPNSFSV